MDKYIKSRFLSLTPVLWILWIFWILWIIFPISLRGEKSINFSGDYFIFSDEDNYLYGSGNIVLHFNKDIIRGQTLYFDIDKMEGVLLGNIEIIRGNNTEKFDSFFFKGPPFKYYTETYRDKIKCSIRDKKKFKQLIIKKKKLVDLKKGALYYEFKKFKIGGNKKIKAKEVIPYIMGLPSLPFKKFTIKRGDIPDKTMIYPQSLNYSGTYGLILSFLLRARSNFLKGDNTFKFFERGLFNLGEPKRGVILSGENEFLYKKKIFLNLSLLANSDDNTFNLVFKHKKTFKNYKYFLSQTISGRKDTDVFYNFKGELTFTGFKGLIPNIQFTHNLKKSYSYKISVPMHLIKNLSLNLSINRTIFKDTFVSDILNFSSSMAFSGAFFNIVSSYNTSKNFIETSLKKNFSFNFNFKTLNFLDKNIGIDLSTFYLFSQIPMSKQITNKISPGFTLNINSKGMSLPFGFKISPILAINQIWDNQMENYTNFNTAIVLRKYIKDLRFSINYGLISHYETDDFWVEGYSTTNVNFNIDYNKDGKYNFALKFLTGNELKLESILLTGKVFFSKKIILSTNLIYYYKEKRMQTMEIFIEKNFRNVFKVQGGYSLALKKVFIKVLTL